MAKRNYPNDYFAWYNDDKRLALVALDTTSTSGERTKEKYDTFQGDGDLSGTITASFTDATCDYNNDPTIAHDDDDGKISVGMIVSGTGIPTGAYVSSVTSDTSFELSASTTTGSVTDETLTFNSISDYSSTVAGTVQISDASHGLDTGDRVSITSSPDSYYDTASSNSDGNYEITKIDTNRFYISATYSAEDSGTWTSLFVDKGLRITYHAFYDTQSSTDNDLETDLGLGSGLQNCLVCYIKARLYEDQGDLEKAMYFRKMYEKNVAQYPSRKSAIRVLSVPYM